MINNQIDGNTLKKMLIYAANNLENNKKIVDELNVFPVPDGDTGTNMALTLLTAAKEIESNTMDNSVTMVADTLAMASLRGARGNSGVILSQLFRGFAKGLKGHQTVDVKILAKAMLKGAETAYKAVMKPTEGTILTVAREGAKKAVSVSETREDIIETFEITLEHAKKVLYKTPDMLPVLKQAGVVDAGGKGLIYILEGVLQALKYNQEVRLTDPKEQEELSFNETVNKLEIDSSQSINYGYCTEFLICKENPSVYKENELRKKIKNQGDSLLIIEDMDIIKVHVHTNEPGVVIQEALNIGELTDIKIDNMRQQHHHILNKENETEELQSENEAEDLQNEADTLDEEIEKKAYGFVAVATGEGIINIFKDLGVDQMVEGGQTMNPSTDDILKSVNNIQAENIFVLANNKNIIPAAEQVKFLTDANLYIIPSKTISQGISAMLAFNFDEDAEDNFSNMTEALSKVTTGQITYAIKGTSIGEKEILEGDILGIKDGKIDVVGQEVDDVSRELLDLLVDEESLMISIFYGQDVDEEIAQELYQYAEEHFPDCDVELHFGGQPLYYYIISVE